MEWFRVSHYPIKYLSVIVIKNGIFLDEGTDFRVSYLTGRIVFFSPLSQGDVINVNYSPLNRHVNGLTYSDGAWYCTSYSEPTPSSVGYPPSFTITNPLRIGDASLTILSITNVTKSQSYDITGYTISANRILLKDNPTNAAIGTINTDSVLTNYKFQSRSVEYPPVETINFLVREGDNYVAFINQNLTGMMPIGTFIRLTNVDSAGDHFFRITNTEFDGEDTVVTLAGTIPSDIFNPTIFLSDSSSMGFTSAPVSALPIPAGAMEVHLPGPNLTKTIRPKSIINLSTDYYYVMGSQYDSSGTTILTTSVPMYRDYTSASILGSVQYSDGLMYYEGDTEISPSLDLIDDPSAVVMSLNYPAGLVTVSSDASSFHVDTGSITHTFDYNIYPTIASLRTGLQGLGLVDATYVSDWTCSKIIPLLPTSVTKDSTTAVSSYPGLRLFGVDTTDYSTFGGEVVLKNSLVRGQRYNLDYLGQRVIGSTVVNFSGSYFTTLPAKSKISASMKYDNIDQFYIQALSERSFLENVTEPRMKAEAEQQSGSVGQGGDLPDDEDQGKSEGGLTNDEYRRMDTAIECRVFDTIFDYFNNRLTAFSNELYASFGWKLCNNDGLLSEEDQSGGALPLNRMFPWSDYTSFPPYKIACLTGQTTPYAVMGPSKPKKGAVSVARFLTGDSTVVCTSTRYPTFWTKQVTVGDLIRPWDATRDYEIKQIVTDTKLILTTPFLGHYRRNRSQAFVMTSKFPLYDDNGHMGAKLVGTESEDFDLEDGDIFDLWVDGTYNYASFTNRPSIFNPDNYTTPDIVKVMNTDLTGVRTTFEWVSDPTTPYGFRESLILRTTGTRNSLILGDGTVGTAIEKLGFDVNSSSFGNFSSDSTYNVLAGPEYPYLVAEDSTLISETGDLSTLIGMPFYDRTSPTNILLVQNIAMDCAGEIIQINGEMPRVAQEIAATGSIIQETNIPTPSGYAQTLVAHNNDSTFMADCSTFKSYSNSIVTNYEGQNTPYRWVLNIRYDVEGQRVVYGRDTTGVGVNNSTYPNIPITGQNYFKVVVSPNTPYDRRFLSTTIDNTAYYPSVTFMDSGLPADGTWEPLIGNQFSPPGSSLTFHLNDTTAQFNINHVPGSSFDFYTDSTAFYLRWDIIKSKIYYYASYPSIGSLISGLNNMAGLNVISGGYDTSSSSLIDATSLTPVTLIGVPVTSSGGSNTAFTIQADGTYNHSYFIDSTSLYIAWDSSAKYYDYVSYPTVGSIKAGINADVPGLDAFGGVDASYSGFKIIGSTTIPPNASIYPALRPCWADYYTTDSQLLTLRDSSANVRKTEVENRLAFLHDRTNQIRQHVLDEEYFVSASGSTGNLYDWANNRFNRSTGCEARLKQIEKLIEMNHSSLTISRMFL
jgi:hypothetical protein